MATAMIPSQPGPIAQLNMQAMAAGMATISTAATMPDVRLREAVSLSRLSAASRRAINKPIQVTGWPIALNRRSG